MEFLPQKKTEGLEFKVPRLPLKQFILFPGLVAPVILNEKRVFEIFGDILPRYSYLFVTPSPFLFPELAQTEEQGTLCKILKWKKLSSGRLKIFLEGVMRASFLSRESEFLVRVKKLSSKIFISSSEEISFLRKEVLSSLKVLQGLGRIFSPELFGLSEESFCKAEGKLIHHLFFNLLEQQELLELKDGASRLKKIHRKIEEEILERRQKKWLNKPKLKEKILKGV